MANIKGNKERAQDIILNHELLLMEQLKFHITVHNPWRPVEGLLIDIKTRLLPSQKIKMDVEKFRPEIESFLDNAVSMTPAALIYAPSQVCKLFIINFSFIIMIIFFVLFLDCSCSHNSWGFQKWL